MGSILQTYRELRTHSTPQENRDCPVFRNLTNEGRGQRDLQSLLSKDLSSFHPHSLRGEKLFLFPSCKSLTDPWNPRGVQGGALGPQTPKGLLSPQSCLDTGDRLPAKHQEKGPAHKKLLT